MATYKLHVSGYIEETQQLLVSFSSDDTAREAEDYQALAFDVVPYGEATPEEIMSMIAKTAPTTTGDIVTQETYTESSDKAEGLKALVGQSFTYTDDDLLAPEEQVEEV